jgi:hypothetical protein
MPALSAEPPTLRRFGPSRQSPRRSRLKLSLIGESPDRLATVTFAILDLIFAGDVYTVPKGRNHSFFSLY